MKILMLADPNSTHTFKWVTALSERGIQIFLFGLNSFDTKPYEHTNIKIYSLDLNKSIRFNSESSLSKIIYLKAVKQIKSLIKEIRPDILHAHYASSYGFLGALCNFKPYIVSVWGSDIQSFPQNSFIHRRILKFSLNRSSVVLATSNFLADQTKSFTKKNIQITPFGVDIHKFNSIRIRGPFNENDVVIGTVKSLEKNYGIDNLIKAFSIIRNKFKGLPLKLLIVGSGTEEKNLKKLAKETVGEADCVFAGFINYDIIQNYHNILDIPVFLSINESFGVSVLESMACCKPVIVSNTGGFREIVDDGKNGYFVSSDNFEETAIAIEKLIYDPELRRSFGENGREKIKAFYEWNKSADLMINVYKRTLDTE